MNGEEKLLPACYRHLYSHCLHEWSVVVKVMWHMLAHQSKKVVERGTVHKHLKNLHRRRLSTHKRLRTLLHSQHWQSTCCLC